MNQILIIIIIIIIIIIGPIRTRLGDRIINFWMRD